MELRRATCLRLMTVAFGCLSLVALLLTPIQAGAQTEDKPTVLFVVDTSGSMRGTKLSQAKDALRAGVAALDATQRAGLRSFAGGCSTRGVERVPIGSANQSELSDAIDSLSASGSTPTPGALAGAADALEAISGPKVIVLISDGQSSCGDPCPTAQDVKSRLGVEFKTVAVGFQAPASAEAELRCVADVTGGSYFSAVDTEGLAEAIGVAIEGGSEVEYVAIGDSTTTGFSVSECLENRLTSPYGCVGEPPATPYPELVAKEAGADYDELERVGIWGYTISDAATAYRNGRNAEGPWTPQLQASESARSLVTVSLGANDMEFSNVGKWLLSCVGIEEKKFFGRTYDIEIVVAEGSCSDAADAQLADPSLQDDMDLMFSVLETTKAQGAEVVVTLYFNPFNESKHVNNFFDRSCDLLHGIAEIITDALNNELRRRAENSGFIVVDFGPAFEGHGAGAQDAFVFGTDCEVSGAAAEVDLDFDWDWPPVSIDEEATSRGIQIRFDPHPNSKGTRAQADAILEVLS